MSDTAVSETADVALNDSINRIEMNMNFGWPPWVMLFMFPFVIQQINN